MKHLPIAITLALATAKPHIETSQLDYHFMVYQAMFSKNYLSLEEYNQRLENFKHTAEMLHDLDTHLSEHGHGTQRVAHNFYSDWSEEERAEFLHFGLATDLYNDEVQAHHYAHLETEHLEHRVDWVERGAVSHVKSDGRCASSWANAAASAVEGAYFI